MSDVVYDLCFLGCRVRNSLELRGVGGQLFGLGLRNFLLVSIASCLLGDDVLHAK